MEKVKKVTVIPATVTHSKAGKIVVIYARESSNSAEQLQALSSQVSRLTQKVANHEGWKLYDIFLDIHSSKVGCAFGNAVK